MYYISRKRFKRHSCEGEYIRLDDLEETLEVVDQRIDNFLCLLGCETDPEKISNLRDMLDWHTFYKSELLEYWAKQMSKRFKEVTA